MRGEAASAARAIRPSILAGKALLEFDAPEYMNHLIEADFTEAYRGHRRQLQHILWRQPRSGHLLLKDPGYLWHLPELLEIYPDARLTVLHRDPVQSVASLCSLTENAQRMTGTVNPGAIGLRISSAVMHGIEQFPNFQEGFENGKAILDLKYADLVVSPIELAGKVFDFLDLPTGAGTLTALETFVGRHPQHKYGRHDYTLEGFDLEPRALSALFVGYKERFC